MNRRRHLHDESALLPRDQFRELCLKRSGGRCVLCPAAAVDAHHIFDRKLFPDGGYRLANAAAVCEACHWEAERCAVSAWDVLKAAGVEHPLLPPCADALGLSGPSGARSLDKWGNLLRPDGSLAPGPLFADPGCRKALAAGGWLALAFDAGDYPWGEAS